MIRFIILLAILPFTAEADNNYIKDCLNANGYKLENFDTFQWNKAAACASDYRVQKNIQNLAELRDFLKHNPRYRVPGQSMNRCWGKEREMPFESVNASASADGSWYIGINYKDTIPAGCYENAPWDNRDKN